MTLPLPPGWRALVAFYSTDDRTSFVAPWRGTLLAGTTDTEYEGDPARAAADETDIGDVLAGVDRLLPPERVDRSRVLAAWTGLRVLRAQRATRRRLLVSASSRRSVRGGRRHRGREADDAPALAAEALAPSVPRASTPPRPGL